MMGDTGLQEEGEIPTRGSSRQNRPGAAATPSRAHRHDSDSLAEGESYLVDSDGEEWIVGTDGKKRRKKPLPNERRSAASAKPVSAYFLSKSNRVNALDYLSKYCILTPEQLRQYRLVFDSLDRSNSGELSHVEVEFGLKTVNKQIITRQELDYVSVVLEVQQVRALNFRMFAVIAALSERVVGLDMLVKGLINAMDAHALATKLSKCKDLFYILDERRQGSVDVEDLGHELHAGRISEEHESIIIDKFTEDGKDEVDFLDFLTYIPLFLEIHDTINENPFENLRDK
eukprot:TRINITY_DN10378_c0_g1_i1.p2 TRINITY_DN10378_c0_g1~~TRINITY_DN10378_c0_g1_i1.p2  ORF type:complete len:287 (+),score=41.96 TRINITY_DN10378_c0_g1_i1:1661-2521(+)